MFKIRNIIKGLFAFVIIIVLIGCDRESNDKKYSYNSYESQFLTATVYNATISRLDNKPFIEQEIEATKTSDDHLFSYDQIQVMAGYSFKTILDFNLVPYFENDYIGQEIEVIISLFQLHSTQYDAWYDQKMIIFKTDSEIVGFLCPQSGIIDELNPYSYDLSNLYFESPMFLTDKEVVKYYERGDKLYTFSVNLLDSENIYMKITSEEVFVTDRVEMSNTIVDNSYLALGSSEVLDIMELVQIEKINIVTMIEGIDLVNEVLTVSSVDLTSLETIELYSNHIIRDLEGNEIEFKDLEIGDSIQIDYYKRYNQYAPTTIHVSEIVVEKNTEEK